MAVKHNNYRNPNDRNVGHRLARGLGKIWNVPNTVVGLVWGGIGLLGGADVSIGNNAIQFENHPLMFGGDITLGNTISYNRLMGPNVPLWEGSVFTYGMHELQHTFQGQQLGPLYLLSNALGLSAGLLVNGNTHGWVNWNERGPEGPLSGRNPTPWR